METNERMIVLYHGPTCMDGLVAAWLIKQKYPDASFHPVQYGQKLPDLDYKDATVWVVDFCYSLAEMLSLVEEKGAEWVYLLDHHATHKPVAEELLRRVEFFGAFDITRSGAELVWDHLASLAAPTQPKPWLVKYSADRDLWKWKMPFSREVNAAMRSYPMTFESLDRLYSEYVPADYRLISQGEAILRCEAQIVNQHVRNAWEGEWHRQKVLTVNASTLISEIGEQLCKGRAFSATFFINTDGNRVWSLRSAPDGWDVGELAKKMGGGGHKHAAGFVTDSSWHI